MIIIAKEIISSGFSADDAKALLSKIDESLEKRRANESIEIDFSDVKYFTTLFFNMALTCHLESMTTEEYEKTFSLKNLSEVGQLTHKHSFDNAIEYYKLSAEDKKKMAELTEAVVREM
ncbi:MAG: STAS-like domain-containing protein [Methanimicrococcus sp.]|nr:STAS-like domain-containing protein [Methanimicrococcus sp.]